MRVCLKKWETSPLKFQMKDSLAADSGRLNLPTSNTYHHHRPRQPPLIPTAAKIHSDEQYEAITRFTEQLELARPLALWNGEEQ